MARTKGAADHQCDKPSELSTMNQRMPFCHQKAPSMASTYLKAMSTALANMLPARVWRHTASNHAQCMLNGTIYDMSDVDGYSKFVQDFCSHLLLTYRYDFDPLPVIDCKSQRSTGFLSNLLRQGKNGDSRSPGLQSDSGWGCMIRVFQMAVAQVLQRLMVGAAWRRPYRNSSLYAAKSTLLSIAGNPLWLSGDSTRWSSDGASSVVSSNLPSDTSPWCLVPILELFLDTPSALFSIHNIVEAGKRLHGIHPGQWFGPTSCAAAITLLMNGASGDGPFQVAAVRARAEPASHGAPPTSNLVSEYSDPVQPPAEQHLSGPFENRDNAPADANSEHGGSQHETPRKIRSEIFFPSAGTHAADSSFQDSRSWVTCLPDPVSRSPAADQASDYEPSQESNQLGKVPLRRAHSDFLYLRSNWAQPERARGCTENGLRDLSDLCPERSHLMEAGARKDPEPKSYQDGTRRQSAIIVDADGNVMSVASDVGSHGTKDKSANLKSSLLSNRASSLQLAVRPPLTLALKYSAPLNPLAFIQALRNRKNSASEAIALESGSPSGSPGECLCLPTPECDKKLLASPNEEIVCLSGVAAAGCSGPAESSLWNHVERSNVTPYQNAEETNFPHTDRTPFPNTDEQSAVLCDAHLENELSSKFLVVDGAHRSPGSEFPIDRKHTVAYFPATEEQNLHNRGEKRRSITNDGNPTHHSVGRGRSWSFDAADMARICPRNAEGASVELQQEELTQDLPTYAAAKPEKCLDSEEVPHAPGGLRIRSLDGGVYSIAAVHSDNGEINVGEISRWFDQGKHPRSDTGNEKMRTLSSNECDVEREGQDVGPERANTWIPSPERDFLSCAEDVCTPKSSALILFVSLRLGLHSFNLSYQPLIQGCFGLPQFQGIAGGGPLTSAYWFIAATDEVLFFLDPHAPVQPAARSLRIETRSPVSRRLALARRLKPLVSVASKRRTLKTSKQGRKEKITKEKFQPVSKPGSSWKDPGRIEVSEEELGAQPKQVFAASDHGDAEEGHSHRVTLDSIAGHNARLEAESRKCESSISQEQPVLADRSSSTVAKHGLVYAAKRSFSAVSLPAIGAAQAELKLPVQTPESCAHSVEGYTDSCRETMETLITSHQQPLAESVLPIPAVSSNNSALPDGTRVFSINKVLSEPLAGIAKLSVERKSDNYSDQGSKTESSAGAEGEFDGGRIPLERANLRRMPMGLSNTLGDKGNTPSSAVAEKSESSKKNLSAASCKQSLDLDCSNCVLAQVCRCALMSEDPNHTYVERNLERNKHCISGGDVQQSDKTHSESAKEETICSADFSDDCSQPCLHINGKRVKLRDFEKMFFPSYPKQLPWNALNPSMTLVFVCQTKAEFSELVENLKALDGEGALSFSERVRQKHRDENVKQLPVESGFLLL